MGLLYLFALVVGLGILLVQIGFGRLHGGGGHADGHDGGAEGRNIGTNGTTVEGDEGIVGLFLSTRFWVFTALGFGLSGALLHYATSVWAVVAFGIAFVTGLCSGTFAAFAFRAATRGGVSSTHLASNAVGRTGRAVATVQKGSLGKVRVELQGQVVDFLATTDEDEIVRGDAVLIEDMKDGIAHVSRRPAELA